MKPTPEYDEKTRGVPEHVEVMSGGGMACKHCGGMVSGDGYAKKMAEGGEVESPSEEYEMAPFDREREELNPEEDHHDTEQQSRTEYMRKGAFVDAIANRKAEPVMYEDKQREESPGLEEMKRKKAERYGFMKRKGA